MVKAGDADREDRQSGEAVKPRWLPIRSEHGGALPTCAIGFGVCGSHLLAQAYAGGRAAVRRGLRIRSAGRHWQRGALLLLLSSAATATVPAVVGFHHVYGDRANLPDLGPFTRFEFPTIGHVYDTNGHPLIALAREHRQITRYDDIPPIVRDAILAAEDKNFFSHGGIDYASLPRVLSKVRMGALVARLIRVGRHDEVKSPAILPQGGSTITQQLVRGVFLRDLTTHEHSDQLRHGGRLPRALSFVMGAPSVNMLARKLEELRLAVWVEQEMRERFGSKRRAKEEILARYASFIYMGSGQYGFATAAEYYVGRPLTTLTVEDADTAALLAGIAKAPRDYAPDARDTARVVRRRNQTLALMEANGFISQDTVTRAEQRALQVATGEKDQMLQAPAVVEHVLAALKDGGADLSVDDLLEGQIQVYTTVDARVQQVVNAALEHGLARYEQRRPSAKGLIQGAVVVLRNRDASILAETGGRQFYNNRSASYSDFNRATTSLRQPGSAMKPLVYLAAFREGTFDLDTMVPDEPIGVPMGGTQGTKWISNYDLQFKGLMPLRQALAESRNAVAVWITEQIGIESVLRTSRSLGVLTPLQPYPTTALGASEVNLLELANAYRTMASGIVAQPYVIRTIARHSGEVVVDYEQGRAPVHLDDASLALIQEGLRGVVRMPTGTAHVLDSRRFAIPVMGKTGTTNEFRDALFVGSTYGPEGLTVAVRIGFDDNRSLGAKETGGRVALPVFNEIMLGVYGGELAGPVPAFPAQMEQRITSYLQGDSPAAAPLAAVSGSWVTLAPIQQHLAARPLVAMQTGPLVVP